jgi:hypothetical protein
MIIEDALQAHLIAQPGMAALVGTKIDYTRAPDKTETPYIVFQKVSDVRDVSLNASGDSVNARFQFSIFADTYYETKLISSQLRLALHKKNNEVIGGVGGVRVSAQFDDERDLYEVGSLYFHCAADYFIQYNE